MNRTNTRGIVLTRVDYGEADRIITFITPDKGKVTAIAKSVRKPQSRLAGGVEVFSVSEIGFIQGKSDISTLVSARLQKHFGNIVKELDRTQFGYDAIKIINKTTEDEAEEEYFDLLLKIFWALDDLKLDVQLAKLWFYMQLLKITGHMPNLKTDANGQKLQADKTYDFQFDQMNFVDPQHREGALNSNHIKFLRLCASADKPSLLGRVNDVAAVAKDTQPLLQSMLSAYVRL